MSARRDEEIAGTPGTEGAGVGDDGKPVTGTAKTQAAGPGKGGEADVDHAGEERAASAELTPSDPDD